MTERLSDERLRGIAWEGNSFLASRFEEMAIARELLELRSKLASGPVVPETPSEEDFMRCFDEMGLIDGSPTGNTVDDCKEAFTIGWRYAKDQSR